MENEGAPSSDFSMITGGGTGPGVFAEEIIICAHAQVCSRFCYIAGNGVQIPKSSPPRGSRTNLQHLVGGAQNKNLNFSWIKELS